MNNFLRTFRRPALILFLAVSTLLVPLHNSWAIFEEFQSLTAEKEKQIGEEFLLEIQQQVPLIEDAFLTSYLNQLGQKIAAQMGPQPFHYKFFIVNDPTMNAFAVPGGYIFIHTGMIRMAEREGEVAGVIAHEISHVYCRHMARTMEKAKVTNVATLMGAMAGLFLGGLGAGAVLGQTLLVGSMAAGAGTMLRYSREFEQEADATGFKWMVKAGYDPRCMLSVFKKLNRQRWFEGGKPPIYLSTHPDVDSRMVDLGHQIATCQGNLPTATDTPEFPYFAVRVEATSGNSGQLLRRMTQECIREPQNPVYHYGKALALAKTEKADEAEAEFQQAMKLAPGNNLIQRDLAITYFNRNRYVDAQRQLEEISRRTPNDEVALYYLGRICQERRQIDQALTLFEKVYNLNPAFTEVYLNLGTVYGEKGKIGLAHYYLGLHSLKAKALPTALFHFRKALQNLPASDNHYAEVKRQVTRLEKKRIRVAD